MWRSKLYSDVHLHLTETSQDRPISPKYESIPLEETVFSAHRVILCSRCPYFATMLLTPYLDNETDLFTLPSPPFTPAAFHFVLAYIYTGSLTLNRTFDLAVAMQIWRAAQYLNLELLREELECRLTDMCHEFRGCCKACRVRAIRVFTFSHDPDVNSTKLQHLSRPIVLNHFGELWDKEIGQLPYSVQNDLVTDVCKSITATSAAEALKAMCQIRQRLSTNKAPWADHVRSMLVPLDDRFHHILRTAFDEVAVSQSLIDLVEGIGFSMDVLEVFLGILMECLSETSVAQTYQVLVGKIMLREDGIRMDARIRLEDARQKIIKYLKKRWINVRINGGFENLEKWCLKELSDGMYFQHILAFWTYSNMLKRARATRIGPASFHHACGFDRDKNGLAIGKYQSSHGWQRRLLESFWS